MAMFTYRIGSVCFCRTHFDIFWAADYGHADTILVQQIPAPLPAIVLQHRLSVQGGSFCHVPLPEDHFLEVEFAHLVVADKGFDQIRTSYHADGRLHSVEFAAHYIQAHPAGVYLSTAEAHQAPNAIVVVSGSDEVHGPAI